MESILLIDTSYLIYRSYFAFPSLSYNDAPTGAIYGFIRGVITLIESLQPTTLVFALDTPHPTWRHQQYDGYKANRSVPDHDMIIQIPDIVSWCRSITPNVLEQPGFEADDIIGTVVSDGALLHTLQSAQAEQKTQELFEDLSHFSPASVVAQHSLTKNFSRISIFSADKDLYQLFLNESVTFVKPNPKNAKEVDIFTSEHFEKKYELSPIQWVDYKALVGDSSDNLSGIQGIGPKTATSLLHTFGSLYFLYGALGCDPKPFVFGSMVSKDYTVENASVKVDSIKPALAEKIIDAYDTVIDVYRLARLSMVPEISIVHGGINFSASQELPKKYNMKSIYQSLQRLDQKYSKPDSLF